MAIDERARHQLYLRLEEQLGPEAATTLMEHLPPVGWADVATKRDLDQLGDRLRAEFHKSVVWLTATIVFTSTASSAAAVFAVAQLR
jgi:hypothetical protein